MRQVYTDGSTALGVIRFADPVQEVTPEVKQGVVAALEGASIPGVEVEASNELVQRTPEVFCPGEALGLLIAAVALVVVLRTLRPPGTRPCSAGPRCTLRWCSTWQPRCSS